MGSEMCIRDRDGARRVDVVALLDEFAANFYQELDYELECANGIRLAEEMRVLPRVKIPRNYPEVTSRRVHTAEWVEGEKLSQSTAVRIAHRTQQPLRPPRAPTDAETWPPPPLAALAACRPACSLTARVARCVWRRTGRRG